jgi:hypothetical protein
VKIFGNRKDPEYEWFEFEEAPVSMEEFFWKLWSRVGVRYGAGYWRHRETNSKTSELT